jgi:hypothetical protein
MWYLKGILQFGPFFNFDMFKFQIIDAIHLLERVKKKYQFLGSEKILMKFDFVKGVILLKTRYSSRG